MKLLILNWKKHNRFFLSRRKVLVNSVQECQIRSLFLTHKICFFRENNNNYNLYSVGSQENSSKKNTIVESRLFTERWSSSYWAPSQSKCDCHRFKPHWGLNGLHRCYQHFIEMFLHEWCWECDRSIHLTGKWFRRERERRKVTATTTTTNALENPKTARQSKAKIIESSH